MSQRIEPKETLLPCPFCGHAPKMTKDKIAVGWYGIECIAGVNDCGIYLYTIGKTEEEATARWNRRANTVILKNDNTGRHLRPETKEGERLGSETIPDCPKCGNNRQVWKNQITGKLTCHRAFCHTVINDNPNTGADQPSEPEANEGSVG